MQSSFKTSLILFSALMVCASNLSTASYQTKPLSCRADKSMSVVASVGSVASMSLGQNYEFGEGVSQDNSQAFEWYCNAAMQNSADAQLKIALFLLEGKGNQRDVSTGLEWLNRAANNGSHDAELALGILLVDTDAIRSAVLFKRAAAGGNLYANHRLAELYYYGMGVPQNYTKAQELSELGVAAGFEKSKELLTRIQIKQDSGVFQPDQSVPAVESIVKIEPQPSLKEELQIEPQKELQNELQNEPQNSSSLLQRFLSILPSLPNMGGNGASPSEVTVTTSHAVDVKAQSAEQTYPIKVPPVLAHQIVTHPVDVRPIVSVTKASAPDIAMVGPGSRLPVVNHKALEDQLVAAANSAIEEENEQEAIVEQSVPEKPTLAEVPIVGENKPVIESKAAMSLATNKPNGVSVKESLRSHDYARNAGWINKQPDMRYAIQLVQATQLDGIFKFIKKHDLDTNAYYIHALQNGEYRYILLYGNYPNNRTSKQVAKTLPDAVQKAGYWIRTFGDLRRSYVISP